MIQNKIKKIMCASTIMASVSIFSSFSYAAQTHSYEIFSINQQSTDSGFWMKSQLPNMYPYWIAGSENKINLEFWFNINDNSDYWVEMGYHNGYDWKSDGTFSNTFYDGCFTAKSSASGWTVSKLSGANWKAGQTHTMGCTQYIVNNGWYTDMRADGTTLVTYSNASSSKIGSIDAGLEFGVSTNYVTQSISVPSSITDLNVYRNGSWKTWSSTGSVYGNCNIPNIIGAFSSSNNQITFK